MNQPHVDTSVVTSGGYSNSKVVPGHWQSRPRKQDFILPLVPVSDRGENYSKGYPGPAEISSEQSDTLWKLVKRDLISRRNWFSKRIFQKYLEILFKKRTQLNLSDFSEQVWTTYLLYQAKTTDVHTVGPPLSPTICRIMWSWTCITVTLELENSRVRANLRRKTPWLHRA